jgi:hypothetical protein
LPKGLKELEKEVGEAQAATEFALVHFDINGVFDIFFFNGAAQVETNEHRGSATYCGTGFCRPEKPALSWISSARADAPRI